MEKKAYTLGDSGHLDEYQLLLVDFIIRGMRTDQWNIIGPQS